VILTGQVNDDDLAALYSGAQALVVASRDEGFGLPAVEALACGAPVVACELRALREVLDGRITFVPSGDLRALIGAAEAVERPAPRPPRWTWQDAARATWRVYDRARSEPGQPRTGGRLLRRRPAAAVGPQ
jgi:glycosyltransferase involved in cell wall biosynthesis